VGYTSIQPASEPNLPTMIGEDPDFLIKNSLIKIKKQLKATG
jgi:hypothetical protein